MGSAAAQDGSPLLTHLLHTEEETLHAIALYPVDERSAILIVAQHPGLLARLAAIQVESQTQFREIITDMPKDDQLAMYSISRFPDLLQRWYNASDQSVNGLPPLMVDFPGAVQEDMLQMVTFYPAELQRSYRLLAGAEIQAEQVLTTVPAATRDAFLRVLQLPEVMILLTDHMAATVLLGDLYQQDNRAVTQVLDSLQLVLAQAETAALQEWTETIMSDSAAFNEFQAAAATYAEEQGYAAPASDDASAIVETTVTVQYLWRPYPYWLGWPYWYTYAYWYPYPWYDWGYYYLPNQSVVFIGLPSAAFLHWHFNHYTHYYYYPHFTHRMLYYTERHPTATNTITTSTSAWREHLRGEAPDSWLKPTADRVERIRTLGAFKMDFQEAVGRQEKQRQTEKEYLQAHVRRYPALKEIAAYQQSDTKQATQQRHTTKISTTPKRSVPASQMRPIKPPMPQQQQVERAVRYHDIRWQQNRIVERQTTPLNKRHYQPSPSAVRGKQPQQQYRKY